MHRYGNVRPILKLQIQPITNTDVDKHITRVHGAAATQDGSFNFLYARLGSRLQLFYYIPYVYCKHRTHPPEKEEAAGMCTVN